MVTVLDHILEQRSLALRAKYVCPVPEEIVDSGAEI